MPKRSFPAPDPEDLFLMEALYEARSPLSPLPSPSLLLQVPGEWPLTLTYSPPKREPVSATASFFSTVSNFIPTVSLKNLLGLPATIAQHFLRPQRVRAEPVIREDGARKKRLIDLGAGDPVTPTKSRANTSRRIRPLCQRQASPVNTKAHEAMPGAFPESPALAPQDPLRHGMLDDVSVDLENAFIGEFSISDLGSPDWASATPCGPSSVALSDFDNPDWASTTPCRPSSVTSSPSPRRNNGNAEIRVYVDKSDVWLAVAKESPPPPPRKKAVAWTTQIRERAFYRDTAVTDMLDSSLASIKDCPDPTSAKARYLPASVEDDDLPLGSPIKNDSSDDESGGLRGVPAETWLDDENSLKESTMSNELIYGLYEEVEKKLKISTPPQPTPVPAVKPLVSPLTKEERKALDAVSSATDYGRNAGADVVPGKLTAHDFGTLLPSIFNGDDRAWLNDNIVNEYMGILIADQKKKERYQHKKNGPAPPVHAFVSQWYTNMKTKKDAVRRWAGRKQLGGENFLKARLVLFPICDGAHWRLLAIKPQERMIEYYDSLGGDGSKYIDIALEYLQMELGKDYVASEWHVSAKQKSTMQKNASDCGIFTVLNALVLLRGEDHKRVISTWGMEDARRRVATTLLAGHPTSEMD